jgi:two-component system response regulator ResD
MDNSDKKQRVLLVEDEQDLLEVLMGKFERSGFEVFGAKNGDEGLALALAHHPDIILLDLLMPKKGGSGMLEELRKDEWGKGAQVIILTNLTGTASVVAGLLEKGVYEYLVKASWSIEDIVKRVKEKLSPKV